MLEMVVKVISSFLLLLILVGSCVLLIQAWWYAKKRLDEMPGSSLTHFEKLYYALGDFIMVAGEWKDYFIVKIKEIFAGYNSDNSLTGTNYSFRYDKKEVSKRSQTMGKNTKARTRMKV